MWNSAWSGWLRRTGWIAAGLAVAVAAPVQARERVALVIGNAAYAHVPRLANPGNDAADLAAALAGLGFAVDTVANADRTGMLDGLKQFSRAARTADIAVVFYAGHGIEVDKANYLVPVDAELVADTDVEFEAVPLGLVTRAVAGARSFGLVILDACRDNPFRQRMAGGTRSIGRGLAPVEPTGGSVAVAYAARDGTTAADGDGRNSPYTRALLNHIGEPQLVGEIFNKVAESVLAQTNRGQEPVVYGRLPSGAYFTAPSGRPVVFLPGDDAPDPVAEQWKVVRDSSDPALVERFLADWPNSRYAGAARALLTTLLPPFTVAAEPDNARIRFVDGGGTYRPGMALRPGNYRVEASAAGYETAAQTFAHKAGAGPWRIILRKPAPKAGSKFKDCPECPEMVVIPAGAFLMGSPPSEERRDSDEGPQHRVTVGRPFALGVYEVTFAEWEACARDGGCGGYWPDDEGWGRGNRPVVNVSWDDAKSYVAWLGRETGESYRLPSEAEWEYAARAGTATPFHTGRTISTDQANYDGGREGVYREKTVAVGSFPANRWGLHDMHGNVWEWTADCVNGSYAGAPSDGSAWLTGDCGRRVLRGGSWSNYDPRNLRAADRGRNATGSRYGNLGFRVARTLAP